MVLQRRRLLLEDESASRRPMLPPAAPRTSDVLITHLHGDGSARVAQARSDPVEGQMDGADESVGGGARVCTAPALQELDLQMAGVSRLVGPRPL